MGQLTFFEWIPRIAAATFVIRNIDILSGAFFFSLDFFFRGGRKGRGEIGKGMPLMCFMYEVVFGVHLVEGTRVGYSLYVDVGQGQSIAIAECGYAHGGLKY